MLVRDLRYLQLYYLAWTFTISFAVHNATEGIAIASPATIQSLVLLSLLAGLPTSLGAYARIANQIFLAFLNVVALASLVFVMIRINW
ncbi:MAG: hypothetical protein QW685_09920 [Saccharolobus sp.]